MIQYNKKAKTLNFVTFSLFTLFYDETNFIVQPILMLL